MHPGIGGWIRTDSGRCTTTGLQMTHTACHILTYGRCTGRSLALLAPKSCETALTAGGVLVLHSPRRGLYRTWDCGSSRSTPSLGLASNRSEGRRAEGIPSGICSLGRFACPSRILGQLIHRCEGLPELTFLHLNSLSAPAYGIFPIAVLPGIA
jgi:hypothetical protein